MKKCILYYLLTGFIVSGNLEAQVNLQNNGVLYVSVPGTVLYVNGDFYNAAGAALTNNGDFYVLQNISNAQAGMIPGTGTLYLSGSAMQTLSGTQLFKTYNLVTNNGAGVLLNNDLSVSNVHTFTAGVITTSSTPNYLIYEAGATYTGDGDNNHVAGWIRRTGTTAFRFPLGNGIVERTITASNLSASAVFNATYAGVTTNTGNLLTPLVTVDAHEYWIINKVSGGSATIDMNWDNSKIAMPQYNLPDIRVADYISGNWTQAGASATGNTATTGNISSNVLSSFGPLTFGSISFSLPVTLVQFSAYRSNNNTIINWTTSDEINVSNYDVQRSDDGINFYSIGITKANNQAGIQQYQLTDSKELLNVAYYRLRSTDIDGKSKLSKIISVSNNAATDIYITVVNPVLSGIHITARQITGLCKYTITSPGGQLIQEGFVQLNAGSSSFINLQASVISGMYVLQIQKTGFSFSQKILVR